MDQKQTFALRAIQPGANLVELCQEYGISRPTGYKWKKRFLKEGIAGLYDRAKKPQNSPNQLTESQVCAIIKLKEHHRSWGALKLRHIYLRVHGQAPSLTSFKRVLQAAGMVKKRRRRDSRQAGRIHYGVRAQGPNDVWTVDFKGYWYVADGARCEPLTVRDEYSRYLLEVRALANSRTESVRACFEQLFARYGLPKAIRSDNGPPFAGPNALWGLSRLSAWWMSLGISLERGRPGKPQDNGAHERLHRDISDELQSHAKGSIREQQAAFDLWKDTFNQQRPHQALGMKVPADVYLKSDVAFDPAKSVLVYQGMLPRLVSSCGAVRIHGQLIRISTALCRHNVGLKPVDKNTFEVYFADLPIGSIDLNTHTFIRTASGPNEASKKPA